MAKGAESSLQSCTVLFCTIKWRGGQPRDNRLLSLKRRPAAPEESSLFSPYGCSRLAGCCARRGRMLGIWTRQVRCPLQHEGEQQGLPGNTAGTPQGFPGTTQEIRERKYLWMERNPNFVGFRVTKPPQSKCPDGTEDRGGRISPMQITSMVYSGETHRSNDHPGINWTITATVLGDFSVLVFVFFPVNTWRTESFFQSRK